MFEKYNDKQKYITVIVIILSIAGLGGGGYFYYSIAENIVKNTSDLEERILELGDENIVLADTLHKEQQKNKTFESQIEEIVGTVGKLDKLSKTDKELLQKYSKIYFLNEHYIPENLVSISPDYLYEVKKETKAHTKMFPYLQELLTSAKKDGVDLKIISAYRSFGEQSALKSGYSFVYGSGANKFSADQGYSEHQLGTTVDFTNSNIGSSFNKFGSTQSFEWLTLNAYKYGFILSYPDNNSYYQYEPWHWRFVGKSLANRLHEEKEYFYDVDQRVIDNYLINIFD